MPTDIPASHPDTPSLGLTAPLHALCFYVAAGITSFGWALCQLLGWNAAPWMPLWFCAALMIYNADRLRHDPADALNIPQRDATSARLRGISLVILAASAAALLALPILRRDWITLALVLGGTLVCLNYSIPLFGFRFKDVPLLKTLFAPSVVAAAVIGLPLLHEDPPADFTQFVLVSLRAWLFLLFNMILCDLRDLNGDRRTGIRSLPVCFGERRTRLLLLALLVIIEVLGLAALACARESRVGAWQLSCILAPLYLGGLLVALRAPRSERFYEWAVEGMLFLPAVSVGMTGAWPAH